MPRPQHESTKDETRRDPDGETRRETAREDEETRTSREEHEGGIGEGPLM